MQTIHYTITTKSHILTFILLIFPIYSLHLTLLDENQKKVNPKTFNLVTPIQ